MARTSVREAIQGLVIAGYLERRGNRLVRRRAAARGQLHRRRPQERSSPSCSRCAGDRAGRSPSSPPRAPPTTSASRSPLLAELRHAADLDEFREIDRHFHALLASACGNPLLAEVHAQGARRAVRLGRVRVAAVRRGQPATRSHDIIDRPSIGPPGDRRGHRQGPHPQGRRRRRGPPRRRRTPHGGATPVSTRHTRTRCSRGRTDPSSHHAYCHFFDDDEFVETDRPGFRRRVITGEHLQLWFWRITGGADRLGPAPPRRQRAARHHHPRRARLPDRRRRDDERARRAAAPATSTSPRRPSGTATASSSATTSTTRCWILDVFSPAARRPRRRSRAVGANDDRRLASRRRHRRHLHRRRPPRRRIGHAWSSTRPSPPRGAPLDGVRTGVASAARQGRRAPGRHHRARSSTPPRSSPTR